jgi:hypothetical protein
MNATTLRLLLLFFLVPTLLSSQIELKLQLLDISTWGVFAKTDADTIIDENALTVSAQVTVVMPAGLTWSGPYQTGNGIWDHNASVVSPVENPTRQYIAFSLVYVENIRYSPTEEVMLFSFKTYGYCPDSLYLIIDSHI